MVTSIFGRLLSFGAIPAEITESVTFEIIANIIGTKVDNNNIKPPPKRKIENGD